VDAGASHLRVRARLLIPARKHPVISPTDIARCWLHPDRNQQACGHRGLGDRGHPLRHFLR
jgi:hypothetical protein